MPVAPRLLSTNDVLAHLERDGYHVISDILTGDDLARLRERALAAIAAAGDRCAFIGSPERPLSGLPSLDAAVKLCADLCGRMLAARIASLPSLELVRCLKHDTARHALRFHYDSYALTAILPLIIPTNGARGDLLLMPNARPLRRTYARNLLDKALLDNPVAQSVLKRRCREEAAGLIRLPLHPGEMILFNGYRTIHTNDDVDAGEVRATGVMHFGLVHETSALRRAMRR